MGSYGMNPYQAQKRANSLSSFNSYGGEEPHVIVHTTKTVDEHGRTKSITTETIRRYGAFELIKTEESPVVVAAPRKKLLSPPVMKYAGSITSNQELESIAEEGQTEFKRSPGILKNSSASPLSVRSEDDGDDSGDSVYSDAFETLPMDKKKKVSIMEGVESKKGIKENKEKKYKDYSRDYWQNGNKTVRKQLSEGEMYERAYSLAMGKVYGTTSEGSAHISPPAPQQQQTQQQQQQQQQTQPIKHSVSRKNSVDGSIISSASVNGFKRYSMRESHNPQTTQNQTMNYNYQLQNKFGTPGPAPPNGPPNDPPNGRPPSEETAVETAVDVSTPKKKSFKFWKFFKKNKKTIK